MVFASKSIDLAKIILSGVTQTRKANVTCSIIGGSQLQIFRCDYMVWSNCRNQESKRGYRSDGSIQRIAGYKWSNLIGWSIAEEKGDKYRRRESGKITVRMSEKVIRNHTINFLPLKTVMHISLCIQAHILFNFFSWNDNASFKDQRPLSKNHNTKHERCSFELLVKVVQLLQSVTIDCSWPQSWKVSPYC